VPGPDPKAAKKAEILDKIRERGGLRPGVAAEVARETGVPEAEIYGAGSFFHLLSEPETRLRVCTGLSCAMRGAREVLDRARAAGMPVDEVSCLAACDRPPAVIRERDVLVEVSPGDVDRAAGDFTALESAACPGRDWRGHIGSGGGELAIDLEGEMDFSGAAFARAAEMGDDAVLDELEASGLQGRGGAGFPAAIKWRGVRGQPGSPGATRYIVLNADESEPGTFKDRDLMLWRPDRVLEGLAIASRVLGAPEVYLYLRGAFGGPWRALEAAIDRFEKGGLFEGVHFHLHAGHGAYICGEETAMLEALEGKRGMPRHKPPFPTEHGLWGKPTLIQNVETIACVPAILERGGAWFKQLGRGEPGTKLYSISGDVERPGTYELPLGVTLDELVEAAGGYVGELQAFSPGGASSGFLPASERTRPLDFKSLAEVGSMMGSAGVVVINADYPIADAVRDQLWFFEVESCGQCAPCRIGTRFLRERLDARDLSKVDEVAWEMVEGSICGLGQTAPLPLTSAVRHFPRAFEKES
jgi:NADH:ubiquinone oxidoreductase subunit F (NADH-binding)/NADH:ubiquinone oxidoreductase subunit E